MCKIRVKGRGEALASANMCRPTLTEKDGGSLTNPDTLNMLIETFSVISILLMYVMYQDNTNTNHHQYYSLHMVHVSYP